MKILRKAISVLSFALALTLAIPFLLPSLQTVTASAESIAEGSNKLANEDMVKDPYISTEAFALYVGQSKDIDINTLSTDENVSSGRWQSSDTSVATINMYGHITAVGEGKTDITFFYKRNSKTFNIYTRQVTVTHGPVTVTTVPESTGNTITEGTAHTVFILDYNLVNAKVAEFYKYLGDSVSPSTVDYIYSYSVSTALTDKTILSKIAAAEKVIIVGLQPTNDNLNVLKSTGKASMNLNIVTWHGSIIGNLDTANLNILSARQVWINLYYANIADANQLNFTDSDSKPTPMAGLALAIYLQYKINSNNCTEITYSDLVSKMTSEVLNEINEEFFNNAKKLLTDDPTFSMEEGNPILHLSEITTPDIINPYTEKHYNVFKDFYNSNYTRGIFTMGQTADKNPICYDAANLTVSKSNRDKVYSWIGGKWKLQTSYPENEYALRVLTWSDGKWNKKVYRYTDSTATTNLLKTVEPSGIQRDSTGNWYMSIKYNDQDYIYQLDEHFNVKYKVCISDLTNSQFSNFYPLMNGKVLLETYDSADTSSDEASWTNALRLYKNLQLVNMESGEIMKEYDTGYYPNGYVKVDGNFIYMRDKSKENIVVIDSISGGVVNIIPLADYDYLIKPHDYSEMLGSRYNYDYTISGKYLYLLKKTGVYRIDLSNGKFRKIMDDSYEPFDIQDMRFLDFKVKNSNTFYILAVNFDSECATDFYTYTK